MILPVEYQRKRNVTHISWCFMCKSSGEDVDHLLLHCRVASRLWWEIQLVWNISSYARHGERVEFSWNCGRWKRRRRAWDVTPLALMWVVWREKTSRASKDVEMDFIQLRNNLSLFFGAPVRFLCCVCVDKIECCS